MLVGCGNALQGGIGEGGGWASVCVNPEGIADDDDAASHDDGSVGGGEADGGEANGGGRRAGGGKVGGGASAASATFLGGGPLALLFSCLGATTTFSHHDAAYEQRTQNFDHDSGRDGRDGGGGDAPRDDDAPSSPSARSTTIIQL